MGNDDILIPGMPNDLEESKPSVEIPENLYLLIDEALSEIAHAGTLKQWQARQNLNVYSTTETDSQILDQVNILHGHLKTKIHDIKTEVSELSNDNKTIHDQLNSLPETFSTKGENTALKDNLESFIEDKLSAYLTSTKVEEKIVDALIDYITRSQIEQYLKDKFYNKREIDDCKNGYIKKDGSTPFLAPQKGVYPKFRKELATAGYVLDRIQDHKNEEDPHGFTKKLNNKLSNYYTRSEVYKKADTYSRDMIDRMIDKLVKEACDSLIDRHISVTPHLTSLEVLSIIKNYALDNLVNKSEYTDLIEELTDQINYGLIWKPTGPVQTTVGFVEDNTELPTMNLQQIMDAIFYDREISLNVPDNVNIGEKVEITVCLHGSIELVEKVELYQDGKLIREFDVEEFEETGCITFETDEEIQKDTEFTLKVTYTNGTELEESKTVKCNFPIFIGSLPLFKFAYTVNYEYLQELEKENLGKFTTIDDATYQFDFVDPKLRHIFIVVPASYPDLQSMTSQSQEFSDGAFEGLQESEENVDIINIIPLKLPNVNKVITYKIYVYKQALSSLNSKITFNFKGE